MKRKIALLLAAVMTTAMLPMNVMASSTNSVNKIDTVMEEEVIEGVKLKIVPKEEVVSNSSIIISIENAEFDLEEIPNFDELVKYESPKGSSYDDVINEMEKGGWTDAKIEAALKAEMGALSAELPYEVYRINDRELQISLAPITDSAVDSDKVVTTVNKPYYLIPIVAVATSDSEDIKITVDDNGSTISSGTYTIARTSAEDGATTTTVADIATGTDTVKIEGVTVKETVKGTFEQGTVKVRVNGGFEIVNSEKIKIEPGINFAVTPGKDFTVTDINVDDSGSYFTFEVPAAWTDTDSPSSFVITGLEVAPEDEDKNWGDINLTIQGSEANITKETIKVGERVDYGFTMTVVDEVPTIVAGRTADANSDLDEDDFLAATVLFEETAQSTWITSRKLEFTVPEGVKIIDAEFDEIERIDDLEDKVAIAEEGTVLKINKGLEIDYPENDTDECAGFEMDLYLSIDPEFAGDVTLSVAGAGLAAETLEDVTIATAIAPISVTTETTKVNMGYQVFDAADITITEAQDGILLDEEKVILSFDDKKFGNYELGFNDADVEYTIDGEVEIDEFEVEEGAITFEIDKTSYTEPSSITISNITVGTTRSVPYGSYDLKIGGEAIVNNYKDSVEDIYDVKLDQIGTEEVAENISYFDENDGYSFDNYVEIITEAGTLDGVVEVTIGEKTITMNGEAVDMDCAAYIQTSSNSTMVPLRFVALALGVDSDYVADADNTSKIAWDANSKTATILYAAGNGQKIIQFQAGSNYMVVDGTSIPMENGVVAEITDSRMFVPFRALGQALGVSVDWDAETRTAIYNKR